MYGIDKKTGFLSLDPRTHLVAIVITGICSLVVTEFTGAVFMQFVAAGYLVANGKPCFAFRSCAGFVVVCALSFLPFSGLYGVMFVSILHMMPPCTVGCALVTSSPSAIMCALDRWHVPQKVLIGICMVFRFASLLGFELRSICSGIRMRGVFPCALDVFRHPALAYECLYTPLTMRCLRLSSELAASAELRGIDISAGRTTVHHVGFTFRDVLAVLVLFGLSMAAFATGRVL